MYLLLIKDVGGKRFIETDNAAILAHNYKHTYKPQRIYVSNCIDAYEIIKAHETYVVLERKYGKKPVLKSILRHMPDLAELEI